jgi:hypothetical protein
MRALVVGRLTSRCLPAYHHDVRTTLTIDDDIALLLEQEVTRSGESYKATVNRLLRLGVLAARQPQKEKRFVVKSFPLGLRAGLSYDSISSLLEEAEGPDHR